MRLSAAVGIAVLVGAVACGGSGPAGPPRILKSFGAADHPVTQTGATADDGGWRFEAAEPGTLQLFQLSDPGVDDTVLYYRARMRTADVKGRAFLEMWVRLPGQGEYFSRGLAQTVTGTSGWAQYEIPFFLKKGQKPDLVKLNVVLDGGGGTVWVKDVQLLAAPPKG